MSELREDPLTGRRVLIAENRAGRPNEYAAVAADLPADDSPRSDCVFCPGNEDQTPPSTFESTGSDGLWTVRSFANKYAAVSPGAGEHEVIVESRRHKWLTGQVTEPELAAVLVAYANRLAAFGADRRYPYGLVFKNVGASAGASLTHLHSQAIALPQVPPLVAAEGERLQSYHSTHGGCGWVDRVAEERSNASRIVLDHGEYVAFCPSAGRQPYETWVMPTDHQGSFEVAINSAEASHALAATLLPVVRAVEGLIGAHGYNMGVHTAPHSSVGGAYSHWRIEIIPRIASLAGLELATGLFLNVLSPERAAERLRAAIAQQNPSSG
ncbi:MAG: hypothetical protein AAGJ46_05970 [Planctomycetota bacterium]